LVSTLRIGMPSSREVGVTVGGNAGSEKPADGGGQGRKAALAGGNDQHRGTESESRETSTLKEKPAGGEGKREDHGGGLRADAQWVILLGVLSAAVTVLAYTGVQWPTLVHIFNASATSSPSPSLTATPPTQPVSTSPTPTFPTLTPSPAPSSSPATVPSPTQESSSPAVGPSDFDSVATDPTDVNAATMLPQQYNDSGTVFDLTSATVRQCPDSYVTAGVGDTLSADGCTSEIDATYLDSSQQIQVAVWVIPMPDKADAEGAYNALTAPGTASDWGLLCPTAGIGSQVCQESWQEATQEAWTGSCHRYLTRALALYVDLQSGSALQPVLTSAAEAAVGAIGAQNISPIAQCWPNTAGS
jgi:hypothetical protein